MKVSLITVVFNCHQYIQSCIDSVFLQDYEELEYIVIDGGSTDGTVAIIDTYLDKISYFSTEKDEGYYHGLNKGISIARGDIIGVLNADDVLAAHNVISGIVQQFKKVRCDAIYGNIYYTERDNMSVVIRSWHAGVFRKSAMALGWMPPHPSLYITRAVFMKYGCYNTAFNYAADYEFILRVFYKNHIKAHYFDKLLVKMRTGGMSNATLKQVINGCLYDYRAMCNNAIPYPLIALVSKKLRKIPQFFTRSYLSP